MAAGIPASRALEVENLSVILGGEPVLADITFSAERARITAIVGPNGAGKTVLFKALLGLVPYQGRITWAPGVQIGYVPQRFSVPPATPITVMEFFLLKSRRFWLPPEAFLEHLPHDLRLVGLPLTVLDRPLGVLSSGELQRLLISWALVEHPDVLLFDEPTAAVDIGFSETILAIMRRLTEERGTAVLLISHDLNVVSTFAAKVVCLNRTILCHGPPRDVLTPEALALLFGRENPRAP